MEEKENKVVSAEREWNDERALRRKKVNRRRKSKKIAATTIREATSP